MATQVFEVYSPPASDVYFRIRNAAGLWLDFDDSTFKAWASAVEPYIVATSSALHGGTGDHVHRAAVDLSAVNGSAEALSFTIEACDNPAPSIADDLIAEAAEFVVQAGGSNLGSDIVCQWDGTLLTTSGIQYRGVAWLEIGGQFAPLASGSCSVSVREQGAGADLFTVTAAAVNAEGGFDLTQVTPGFIDDRQYTATVTITTGGIEFKSRHGLQVQAA